MLQTIVLVNIFVEMVILLSLMESLKDRIYLIYIYFFVTVKVFIVTFGLFNAYLLNKSINVYKKKSNWPQTLER